MTINPIPFLFAKKHQVLFVGIEEARANIIFYDKPSIHILNELRRYFQLPLKLTKVEADVFGKLLVKHYETDSNTAMQMAEDLGGSTNLLDLIHELPKPEDLLESQDDAPIVRL